MAQTESKLELELKELRDRLAALEGQNTLLREELARKAEAFELSQVLLDKVEESVFLTDVEGTLIQANQAFFSRFGKTREQMMGRNLWDHLSGDSAKSRRAKIDEALSTQKAVRFEDRRAGLYLDNIITPLIGSDGGILWLAAISADITRRKLAETSLDESEGKFAKAFYNAPILMSISDIETGAFIDVNDEFLKVSEYTREEVIGMTSGQLGWAPQERRSEVIKEFKRTGSIKDLELTVYSKSGKKYICSYSCELIIVNGKHQLFSVAQDITERKATQAALADSEAKFRILVENSADVIFALDCEGVFKFVSPSWEKHFGIKAEDAIGRDFRPFVHPDDAIECAGYLGSVLTTGVGGPSPAYRVKHADGSWRTFLANGTSFIDASGTPVYIGIGRDMTAQIALEEALRQSEEDYRRLVEISPAAVIVHDKGDIIFCNKAAQTLLMAGRAEDILGKNVFGFVETGYEGVVRERYKKVYGDRTALAPAHYRIARLDGVHIDVEMISQSFLKDGRIQVLTVMKDITEETRAKAALRSARDEMELRVKERTAELETAKIALEMDIEARIRAESEKEELEKRLRRGQVLEAVGQLAGGIAHDFNNILGAVVSCIYAAGQHQAAGESAAGELDKIRDICKRGGDLTRRLLEYARQIPGRLEPVHIDSLLDEAAHLLTRTLPKDIVLEIAVEPGLATVRADRSMLGAAILNLSLNARDAMPRGGRLGFSAYSLQNQVILDVTDTGEGIDSDIQERIFEPFFTTKPVGKGTGLGLSMCYGVMQECGGDITLLSEPGKGTTFRLTFPVSTASQPVADQGAAVQRHPLTDKAVLVVEDEDLIAIFEEAVLSTNGYRTLRADTGAQALEVFKNRLPDIGLVILDVIMPQMDGLEVHRHLEKISQGVPVLFVTGRYDVAGELGPSVRVLAKPFTDEELLDAVGLSLGSC